MVRFLSLALVALTLVLTGCASTPPHSTDGEVLRGLGTWYGPGFHGKLTANGEIYNMNAMTAASRTLPFGTIVRVTNESNGANVELRINDRGPFGDDDRIIDVSSAAADVLQMKGAGVIPVQVQILEVGNGQRIHNG